MAAAQIGLGTATFGSVFVGVFSREDGFTYSGKSVPEVKCTSDTDTTETYASGDTPEFGSFTATLLVADGVDIDAVVATTETLTLTLPDNDTRTGSAILLAAPITTAPNAPVKAAVNFKYTGSVTFAAVV